MKRRRHEAILRLIEANCIATQTELQQKLSAEGFKTTQATISRDIKDLRLIKKADEFGRTCYSVDKTDSGELSGKYKSVFDHSVVNCECAQNIICIKCYNGMAMAACAALDAMMIDGIVGTLAGDDTIFVLCRDNDIALSVKDLLTDIIR